MMRAWCMGSVLQPPATACPAATLRLILDQSSPRESLTLSTAILRFGFEVFGSNAKVASRLTTTSTLANLTASVSWMFILNRGGE